MRCCRRNLFQFWEYEWIVRSWKHPPLWSLSRWVFDYPILPTLSCTRYWQQLDLYEIHEWEFPKDGTMYKQIVEKKPIFKFLMRLNKDLDEVWGIVLGTKPLPSIHEAVSEVRQEECRKRWWWFLNLLFQQPDKGLPLLFEDTSDLRMVISSPEEEDLGVTIAINPDTRRKPVGKSMPNLLTGSHSLHDTPTKKAMEILPP